MDYELSELIDTFKLQAILDDLYNITGLPSAIFDLKGKNITDSGWQKLCIDFYKANSTTSAMCTKSNLELLKKVIKGKNFAVSRCAFGITNIGSPIIIEGKPIGVITVGQFFIEEPNVDSFMEHVQAYGFNKEEFIEAFHKVPIVSLKKAIYIADFVEKFAEMIAEMGLNNIRLRRNEKIISKTNLKLEKLVKARTQELKKISEYDELKTEFLANISHDLRTPINIIFCSLQMLKMYIKNDISPNAEKVDRQIAMMKQNSYRLIRLIDNLIDITKIDNGSYKLIRRSCDIVKFIEKITLSVSEYAQSKDLTLQFTTDAKEAILACDPDKIERVILNLLSNSIKFTPAGGTITVSIAVKNKKAVISVKDTGIGIPEEKRSGMFIRFSQLNSGFTRQQEGSGIGLALVKSLVEMHGGSVYINPDYNSGCEIIIELPIAKAPADNDIGGNIIVSNIERIKIEFSDIYDYID